MNVAQNLMLGTILQPHQSQRRLKLVDEKVFVVFH